MQTRLSRRQTVVGVIIFKRIDKRTRVGLVQCWLAQRVVEKSERLAVRSAGIAASFVELLLARNRLVVWLGDRSLRLFDALAVVSRALVVERFLVFALLFLCNKEGPLCRTRFVFVLRQSTRPCRQADCHL